MTSESESKVDYMKKYAIAKSIKSYRGLIWLSVMSVLLVSYYGVIVPSHTYIKCNDPAISHEIFKDTISVSLLLTVCLLFPLVKMTIIEWLNPPPGAGDPKFLKGFKKSLDNFWTLLVGGLFAFFLVEILKTSVSEARPHFMSSCRPALTDEQCSSTWIHVTWENCTNPYNLSHRKILDTMKSFPSGHACLGIFTSLFMAVYTHARLQVTWSRLFPWALQLLWWVWGLLCCFSRIWDFKHFWWDVAVGGIIGAIVAYATVAYACNWFKGKNKNYLQEIQMNYQQVTATEVSPNSAMQSYN